MKTNVINPELRAELAENDPIIRTILNAVRSVHLPELAAI